MRRPERWIRLDEASFPETFEMTLRVGPLRLHFLCNRSSFDSRSLFGRLFHVDFVAVKETVRDERCKLDAVADGC